MIAEYRKRNPEIESEQTMRSGSVKNPYGTDKSMKEPEIIISRATTKLIRSETEEIKEEDVNVAGDTTENMMHHEPIPFNKIRLNPGLE